MWFCFFFYYAESVCSLQAMGKMYTVKCSSKFIFKVPFGFQAKFNIFGLTVIFLCGNFFYRFLIFKEMSRMKVSILGGEA
jgi:hypothetical protein